MKNLPSFQEFLNESRIMETVSTVPIIAKTGDTVWRLMDRYNPQLGTYYVFTQQKVTRVNANSISCEDGNIYDKSSGVRKNKSTSAYGSADYTIMNDDEAERINSELGKSVRGFVKK